MQNSRRSFHPEKVIEQNRKSLEKRHALRDSDPEAYKDEWWVPYLKREYGLTKSEYQDILDRQNGACAICKKKFSNLRPYIDHKHNSNPVIVRGILCMECNTGLGKLGDSSDALKAALEYVSKYE